MSLVTRTLGEICDEVGGIIRTGPFGSQLHQSDYQDEGLPVIMPKDIVDGKVSVEGITRIGDKDIARLSQHRLQKGNIVYGRRGDIGRRALITEREAGWLCGTGCLRVSLGESVLDPIFLYYYLGESKVIAWIYNQAIGATMPNLNTSIIRRIPITYPTLPIQRKIAGILSAYDRLIENNTRRIEILEEMARSIYREWFVKFRFPGHQQAQMVDSELGPIPEGWEVISLGQLLDIKHGYAFKGEYFSKEPTSDILLTPGNFKFGGGFKDDKFKYYDGSVPDEFVLNPGDLLVTMTDLSKEGDTLGYPAFVPPSKELHFLHNQRLGKIRLNNPQLGLNHLYHIFCSDSYRHHVLASATGATVKHTAPDRIKSFSIALPPPEICNRFEMITSSFSRTIVLLTQKNTNLRQTRDLLLPRLISGEIDVENLNINIDQIAA
jgi:type I restriction enzyme, S subunit